MQTPPAAPPESTQVSARQRVLAMHLERTHTFCELYAEQQDCDVRLDMGGQCLTLEPWARECILSAANEDDIGAVLAQGIALLMKIASDFEAYEAVAGSDRAEEYTLQAELMLDTAIGTALMREMQHAVNAAVASGEMERAKGLSRFQHELRRGIATTKKGIAQAEEASVERLADSLTLAPRDEAPTEERLPRLTGQAGETSELRDLNRRIRRRVVGVATRLPARTDIFIGVLVFASILWFGTVKLPGILSNHGPRPLTLGELQSEAISHVDSRPPSLFVHLDEDVWLRLADDGKDDLLERVSVILLTNGYSGALFLTESGKPVARWLVGRGSEMVLTDEQSLEPASTLQPALRFGVRSVPDPQVVESASIQ